MLKASEERGWAAMSDNHVRKSCKAFRSRIEVMLATGGEHFKN